VEKSRQRNTILAIVETRLFLQKTDQVQELGTKKKREVTEKGARKAHRRKPRRELFKQKLARESHCPGGITVGWGVKLKQRQKKQTATAQKRGKTHGMKKKKVHAAPTRRGGRSTPGRRRRGQRKEAKKCRLSSAKATNPKKKKGQRPALAVKAGTEQGGDEL